MALRTALANASSRLLNEHISGVVRAPLLNAQFVRHRKTKHWLPKWKQLRRLKVIPVKLPELGKKPSDLTEEEMRSRMKEQGLVPPRPWMEHQHFISSSGDIFEPYVPPEGDGKVSPISAQGAKQNLVFLEKKSRTMLAVRKIRQYDEDFDGPEFCKSATDIYIKMHECMAANDKETLINYITERAYPEVVHNIDNKTLRWKYLKDIELPRIVHARNTEVITPDNVFAQVTVRFHTQQTLAIYDRFGRLMHGSEILAKDVLEYVVFEKHLSNQYGLWRVHAKIIPTWLPPKDNTKLTYRKVFETVVDPNVVPHDDATDKTAEKTPN
ncbi:hypothetical protein HUJ04_013279 [Dendroctonus ponderosae]|uniref:Large ribosomal subunit protein mL45 n=1 Tax=Dendroctonus ponderosae TaxID=77166 RepID=J3JW82_DENPD